MKRVQVIRTHSSPYQAPDFADSEKLALEVLGISYTGPENWVPGLNTILITNTHTELAKLNLEMLKSTQLIVHPNSGYDNFVPDQEHWKNIPIIVGHKIRAQAVAEYCLSCLFEGLTELPRHLAWDKERRWNRALLGELSVTIFGHGHIGKIVSNTLVALGSKVNVIDPYIASCPHPHYKTWQESPIKESQAVIVACGLNQHSRQLFNKKFFSALHNQCIFINGARGKLVEEKALREFLIEHPRAFAFLDVFEDEPFGNEWVSFPQVWKTSHIAGVFKNLDQKIIDFEVEVIGSFLNGENLKQKYAKELLQNKFVEGVLI